MEKELINITYQALMGNTTLDKEQIENQELKGNIISFDYKGYNVFLVMKITELKSLI